MMMIILNSYMSLAGRFITLNYMVIQFFTTILMCPVDHCPHINLDNVQWTYRQTECDIMYHDYKSQPF